MDSQESSRGKITKDNLPEMVQQWMEYVRVNFTDIHIKRLNLDVIKKRMLAEGYTTDQSPPEENAIVREFAEQEAIYEQKRLLETNQQRLLTLARIMGKKPKDLKGTTIVSIGGGPGDILCEPWFPRVAAITQANVINFDYSQEHPIDKKLGIYTHIGESQGDVFRLLLHNKTIYKFLRPEQKISIIECNNLIGNNVSPSLGIALGELSDLPKHPKVVEMRQNLQGAAKLLLSEGGILAIDNAYWLKKGQELIPVEESGEKRNTPTFPGEKL